MLIYISPLFRIFYSIGADILKRKLNIIVIQLYACDCDICTFYITLLITKSNTNHFTLVGIHVI